MNFIRKPYKKNISEQNSPFDRFELGHHSHSINILNTVIFSYQRHKFLPSSSTVIFSTANFRDSIIYFFEIFVKFIQAEKFVFFGSILICSIVVILFSFFRVEAKMSHSFSSKWNEIIFNLVNFNYAKNILEIM